ncbi:uncharacterized protein LOC128170739 isoform X1 [Crassostrea angulata]|uniref:uncharacterized protein LOC128170739 isoform X1 n=1 Tax=Magallana angulata TaxID=2784310 RepID=UPI0022B1114E|nr:uncharacterized protein LOC128170739 isoform X1 [Crassostrea angulata]
MVRCGAILRLLISIYLVNYVNGQLISGNVLQILQRTTGFSKFAQLVVRAQLTRLYESPTSLTLFAFNDTAYNNLPYKERNVIDSYTEKDHADYIKFCTIYGTRLTSGEMRDNLQLRSMDSNGDKLFINRKYRSFTVSPRRCLLILHEVGTSIYSFLSAL